MSDRLRTASGVPGVVIDRWTELRQHTAARIALGRAGASLPTAEVLKLGLAHAQARDAVLTALDVPQLVRDLQADGWSTQHVASRAASRSAYLARPDWGRSLDMESAAGLTSAAERSFDLVFVVSDGLSSSAVQRHAVPLLHALRPLLADLNCGPVIVATQARVALADEVGAILGAKLSISLIGERPGLSSPDSLGAYLTFAPRTGRNDAERNCISNIRPQGLGYAEAALQIAALAKAALRLRISGVELRFDPSKMLD